MHVAADLYSTGISIYPLYNRVIVIPNKNSLDSFGLKFVKVPLCE